MKSTVIVTQRGQGYIADVYGQCGGGHRGLRIGLTADHAAAKAVSLLMQYARRNPDGGSIIAPSEVLEHIPEDMRHVKGE